MPFQYIIFNKPYRVLCQFTPSGDKITLKDFGFPPHVYPIGRLDYDSEGLLLLSDDKKLVDLLLNPNHEHERVYLVQVENIPSSTSLRLLSKGLEMGDYVSKTCEVQKLDKFHEPFPRNPPIRVRKNIPDTWLEIKLREGKNRQVRKSVAKIGHPCLRLIRIQTGKINLNEISLSPGQWQKIDRAQIL